MTWSRATEVLERRLAEKGYLGSVVAPAGPLKHKGKWYVELGPHYGSARFFESLAEVRMYVEYLTPEAEVEQEAP